MKRICQTFIFLLALQTMGCKRELPNYEQLSDDKENTVLTLQKGLNGRQALVIFPQEGNREEQIGVNYGGVGLPSSDIEIRFEVDNQALDSINEQRIDRGEEPFLSFPAGSYGFDKEKIVIKSGTYVSDFLTLIYNSDDFELDKQYLLVLKATNTSGYKFALGVDKIEFIAAVM